MPGEMRLKIIFTAILKTFEFEVRGKREKMFISPGTLAGEGRV